MFACIIAAGLTVWALSKGLGGKQVADNDSGDGT
jgi:hypothetical protein